MHPESWPYYNKRHTSREKAGGFILAKTFRDLKAHPELVAAEFPEIHAALQELPQRFHQMAQDVQNSIIALVRPPIPQITLSPLLLDLIAAAERDRAAIARLSKQREALRQISPDLLIDAILWPHRNTPSPPGRPVGSNRFPNKDAFLCWLAPHINTILKDNRYPSLAIVAGQMAVDEGTIRYHLKKFYKDWKSLLSNFV
jgi:hypothetical protein